MGVIEVVVDHARELNTRWRRFVGSHPQAALVYQDEAYTTYRVQRGPRSGLLENVEGDVLPVSSITAAENAALVSGMTDGDLLTRWHAGREQQPGDAIAVDLGRTREVNGVEMLIAGYTANSRVSCP